MKTGNVMRYKKGIKAGKQLHCQGRNYKKNSHGPTISFSL